MGNFSTPHHIIQPYGLRRSGTNFVENIILNHFDSNYDNTPSYQNICESHPKYLQPESLKHTLPTLNHSDFIIIIYKPFEIWGESMKKYGQPYNYKIWETFHTKVLSLPFKKTIITDWYKAVTNYDKFIIHIAEKFNLPLDQIHPQPKNKMNRSHGESISSSQFTPLPYKNYNKENILLKQLKECTWNL